jgi:hypothetical protein
VRAGKNAAQFLFDALKMEKDNTCARILAIAVKIIINIFYLDMRTFKIGR